MQLVLRLRPYRQDIDVLSRKGLDIEHRSHCAGDRIVLNRRVFDHLIQHRESILHRSCYFAINASISPGSLGTLLVSTRAPFSVTSTSSSMRTPMPRYFSGTSWL